MAVRCYARMSTSKQVASPKIQVQQMLDYAEAMKLCPRNEVVIYQDLAVSARRYGIDERPQGRLLCRQLEKGDILLIAKLDRAFRSFKDMAIYIDDWAKRGVSLHIVTQGGALTDIQSPAGKLFVRLLGIIAEFDNDLRAERVKEAVAARKEFGIVDSRRPPMGYAWTRKVYNPITKKYHRMLTPCQVTRDVARSVVTMRHHGLGWEQIADVVRKSGVEIPGVAVFTRAIAEGYYRRMGSLGMIEHGLPTAEWKDHERAKSLLKEDK